MRSGKAPPNQKNRGQFLPNPPEPTGAGIRTSPEPHRSRIELRAGVKSIGLGNVIPQRLGPMKITSPFFALHGLVDFCAIKTLCTPIQLA
jgi:hypothetical protein